MFIFESVIHASSLAFLNRFVFPLRNFSRSRRSFVTLAIFKRVFLWSCFELIPKFLLTFLYWRVQVNVLSSKPEGTNEKC